MAGCLYVHLLIVGALFVPSLTPSTCTAIMSAESSGNSMVYKDST